MTYFQCKHSCKTHLTDSHSCHTYEDQATQTEDEDDNDPDLRDVAILPYGERPLLNFWRVFQYLDLSSLVVPYLDSKWLKVTQTKKTTDSLVLARLIYESLT